MTRLLLNSRQGNLASDLPGLTEGQGLISCCEKNIITQKMAQKSAMQIFQSLARSRLFWFQSKTKKSSYHPFDTKICRMQGFKEKPSNFVVFAQKDNILVFQGYASISIFDNCQYQFHYVN